jgi:hypothetical protein
MNDERGTMTDEQTLHVILSAAKDLKLRILRSFAVFAAQDDEHTTTSELLRSAN